MRYHLISLEARLLVNQNLEILRGLLDPDVRRTAEVSVCIVAVTKSETVNVAVALIVCGTVVQEATNASALYLKTLQLI